MEVDRAAHERPRTSISSVTGVMPHAAPAMLSAQFFTNKTRVTKGITKRLTLG